jgi:glycosyltransferase involved in cell wall biosynthesis
MVGSEADGLTLSVVMPVRNGAPFLRRSLGALRASDLPPGTWELVVVDDGSQDASADIAAELADRVLRLPPPPWGPPAARNHGAKAARAPLIVFVDADVCVHPNALGRIRDALTLRPELSAVFGAYDPAPTAQGLISQYRNLLHTYVHHRDAGEVVTFWTGLGGIRRDALLGSGGFDEGERIDDVELGYRLAALGHRILLDPTIQGTHLKRWTLANLILTDVRERGVPWVRLLLKRRDPVRRSTLSVRPGERVLTAVAGVAVVSLGANLATGDWRWLLLSGVAASIVLGGDLEFFRWLGQRRGRTFAIRVVPLRLLYYLLNVVSVGIALLPGDSRRRRGGKVLGRPAI